MSATATEKKTVSKKTTKAAKHGKGKKGKGGTKKKEVGGLRRPQLRILSILAKGKSLTRSQIAEKAPVDNAMCTTYIGSNNPDIRKKTDKNVVSLLTLKYVRAELPEEEGRDIVLYTITALGKKTLNNSEK